MIEDRETSCDEQLLEMVICDEGIVEEEMVIGKSTMVMLPVMSRVTWWRRWTPVLVTVVRRL